MISLTRLKILGTLIVWGALLPSSSGEDSIGKGDPLKAMTFNIRMPSESDGANKWPNRKQVVFDYLNGEKPDILGVQEAFAFQLKEIETALPSMIREGVGRDDGKEAGEFSAVLLNRDRLEKLAGGTFWLSDTPDKPGSITWGNACTRICSWARVKDKRSGQVLAIYNGHFDHVSAPSRLKSAELIAKKISEHGHDKTPVIVMGDFNTGPKSDPITFLLEKTRIKFTNTLKPVTSGSNGTFHGWRGTAKGKQIDYILTSPGIHCHRAAIVRHNVGGRYLSDHYPVLAELSVPSPAKPKPAQ